MSPDHPSPITAATTTGSQAPAKEPIAADFSAEVARFRREHPDVDKIELLFPDLNGILRGKWLPIEEIGKLSSGGIRLPTSTYALDIWGEDVDATGLALDRGDPDGIGHPVPGTLTRVPWAPRPTGQVLMGLSATDAPDKPSRYDPRQRLVAVLDRFANRGLTPVVATELEFYLFDPNSPENGPPRPPAGAPSDPIAVTTQLYDLDVMASQQPLLDAIRDHCAIQAIPAGAAIAEFGPGQFEINMHHVPDALAAADHGALFRRLVRHTARCHGLEATFMPKPHADHSGSGMHVHVSLLDRNGANVFAAETGVAAPLAHAVGGLKASMADMMAVFAPHANSYRRFQPRFYVPLSPNWGLDHRGVAIRVPATTGMAARLEHRVCGADVNPYLALTAILGGMLYGLENAIDPGPAEDGAVEPDPSALLPNDWAAALTRFEASPIAEDIFGADYKRVYAACRRSELATFAATITDMEYRTYLRRL